MGSKCGKQEADYSPMAEESETTPEPGSETNAVGTIENENNRGKDDILTLDVGGQVFKTSKRTLLRAPQSKLADMANGQEVFRRQDDGSYIIDRDPERFR